MHHQLQLQHVLQPSGWPASVALGVIRFDHRHQLRPGSDCCRVRFFLLGSVLNLEFTTEFQDKTGKFDNKIPGRRVEGIGIASNTDRFITD